MSDTTPDRFDNTNPSGKPNATQPRSKSRGISDPFSAISHMVGAGLSIAALVVLLVLAHGRPWHTVSFAIYGATMILLYTASSLHHSIRHVHGLERLDHAMIYLLIAGSYTPLCLIILRGPWGWSIFGVEWGLTVIGVSLSIFWKHVPDWLRLILYLAMGWLIVIAIVPLREAITPLQWHWLVAGGVTYTVGAIVFATDWPHLWPGKFHAHDLWHLFVLGGSLCHFIVILLLVIHTGHGVTKQGKLPSNHVLHRQEYTRDDDLPNQPLSTRYHSRYVPDVAATLSLGSAPKLFL